MTTDNLQAMAVIVGLVNGFRLAKDQDKWGLAFFVTALVLGVIFGVFGLFGLDLETGIIAALASSGLYRVSEKIGGQ